MTIKKQMTDPNMLKKPVPKPNWQDKNPIPQAHWEVNRDLTPEGSPTPVGAFLPTAGKNRAAPHIKTNECDH